MNTLDMYYIGPQYFHRVEGRIAIFVRSATLRYYNQQNGYPDITTFGDSYNISAQFKVRKWKTPEEILSYQVWMSAPSSKITTPQHYCFP